MSDKSRGRLFAPLVAVLAIYLAGCAAKPVTPVHMVQAGDEDLNCTELAGQVGANNMAATQLLRDDKDVENGNIAKGVGGVIPGLGLLLVASTDLSNAEQIKARAIIDRNERLTYLMAEKGCKKS